MILKEAKVGIVGASLGWTPKQIQQVKGACMQILLWQDYANGHYCPTNLILNADYKEEGIDQFWKPNANLFEKNIFVSGGCTKGQDGGVDHWAEEVADKLGLPKIIHKPEVEQWEDLAIEDAMLDGNNELYETTDILKGYKSRNLDIARDVNVLYYLLPKSLGYCYHCKEKTHRASGACWTANQTKLLGKPVFKLLIP